MSRLRPVYLWVLFWSGFNLLLERLWGSFWPAFSLLLFFAALAFFGAFAGLGGKTHTTLLFLFLAGFLLAGKFLGAPFRRPRLLETERRIELQSGLSHRPLHTLRDKPLPNAEDAARSLWQKHLERMKETWSRLHIYTPRPDVARRDPWSLRHAAILLFAVGVVFAGAEAPHRLMQAFKPGIRLPAMMALAAVDAWITPPEYTGAAPVYLASAKSTAAVAEGPVSVPEGSILKLRISGSLFQPVISHAGKSHALERAGKNDYTLELPLQESGGISLRKGLIPAGSWDVEIIPDQPPAVEILLTGRTPQAALKITYQAVDDYGIDKMHATVSLVEEEVTTESHPVISFDLPSARSGKEMQTHVEDLTSHPWAGMPVTLTLTAEDGRMQATASAPKVLVLPERKFSNPGAQMLIGERKRLTLYNNFISRKIARLNISGVAEEPGYYKGDPVVFLGLVIAIRRLAYNGENPSEVDSVRDLLWNLALRIEDSGLTQATQELSKALQELSAALQDKDATEDQLQELLAEVQKKMAAYVKSMAMEMQQRLQQDGQDMKQLSPELAEKVMKHVDMDKLLEQMKAMSEGDAREQMQKMAEFLKNAVDNTDPQKLEKMRQAQEQAVETLQGLEELIQEQQKLLSETSRKEKDGQCKGEAGQQGALREKLGGLVRKLGEMTSDIPKNFSQADQSMKGSEDALKQDKPQDSAPHQKAALDELQQGLDELAKQIAQQMQQQLTFGLMPGMGSSSGGPRDPLGRETGGIEGDVKIPEEGERRRVQEIIQELRGRSNDYQRPKIERDYIDRLLNQFN